MDIQENKQPNRPLAIIVILCIVAAASFIAYLGRDAIYAEMNHLGLIPTPERFTELYFENSAALPTQTVADQAISFSFTIHNVEGTSTVYPYEVYFEDPLGSKIPLTNSSVSLADGASTTISVSYAFPESNEMGMIVVSLTQLDQQIDFLLSNPN